MSRLRRLPQNLYTRRTLLLCAALCSAGVVLLSTAAAEQRRGAEQTRRVEPPRVQRRAQPLDPLTPDEVALATRVAESDRRVREALGTGRVRLIRVEFLALKTGDYREIREPEQLRIGRHAAVVFYSYEADQGVHVVVDLEQQTVGDITRLEGRVVPLAAAEVSEAFGLALRDERVRALLGARAGEFRVAESAVGERGENRVEGLRVVAASPEDSCYGHRCLVLLFRGREGYIAGSIVGVDLTAQTVRVERSAR